MKRKYLVVVYPAPVDPPTVAGLIHTGASVSYTNGPAGPTVKWVTASNPVIAAEEAKVQAGGYALVIAETNVQRFDRARKAPLVAKHADGSDYPQGEAA